MVIWHFVIRCAFIALLIFVTLLAATISKVITTFIIRSSGITIAGCKVVLLVMDCNYTQVRCVSCCILTIYSIQAVGYRLFSFYLVKNAVSQCTWLNSLLSKTVSFLKVIGWALPFCNCLNMPSYFPIIKSLYRKYNTMLPTSAQYQSLSLAVGQLWKLSYLSKVCKLHLTGIRNGIGIGINTCKDLGIRIEIKSKNCCWNWNWN